MSDSLRTRSLSNRVFLLSGLTDAERKNLSREIVELGGLVFDKEVYCLCLLFTSVNFNNLGN